MRLAHSSARITESAFDPPSRSVAEFVTDLFTISPFDLLFNGVTRVSFHCTTAALFILCLLICVCEAWPPKSKIGTLALKLNFLLSISNAQFPAHVL